MNDSSVGNADTKDMQNFCAVCKKPLPSVASFCPYCDPPSLPDDAPDEGMGFGQTFIRIALIVLFFTAIAIFKLDISLTDNSEETVPDLPGIKSSEVIETKKQNMVDYETINHIKVDKSQVRQEPSHKGKVLTVLEKGSKVTVLDSNEDWWKIKADGQTGWISREDLDFQIR